MQVAFTRSGEQRLCSTGWAHPASRTVGQLRPEKTARESTVNQCEWSAGSVIARSISGHLDLTKLRINSVPAWSHAICTASSFPSRIMKPFTKVSYSRLLGSHIPINWSCNPEGSRPALIPFLRLSGWGRRQAERIGSQNSICIPEVKQWRARAQVRNRRPVC